MWRTTALPHRIRSAGSPRRSPARGRTKHRRGAALAGPLEAQRSEEHTSELQSLMRISYAVFCLTKKTEDWHNTSPDHSQSTAHRSDVRTQYTHNSTAASAQQTTHYKLR